MSDVSAPYARPTEAQRSLVAEALQSRGYAVWRDDELPVHRAYDEGALNRLGPYFE